MLYSYGYYSRVPISWNEFFSKILKKPFIVRKQIIPHMNELLVFIEMKQKIKNGRLKKTSFSSSANSQFFYENFMDWSLELIDAKGIGLAQLIWS